MKLYFCNTIGDGSIDDPFRPAISQYTDNYRAVDAREDPTIPGLLMVECPTISDEQHNLAILNPDITYFDTEGLLLDDFISKIPDRATLKAKMAQFGLNFGDLTSANSLREIMSSVTNQLLKRQNPNHVIGKNHYDR